MELVVQNGRLRGTRGVGEVTLFLSILFVYFIYVSYHRYGLTMSFLKGDTADK